jgi:hypothetical protein
MNRILLLCAFAPLAQMVAVAQPLPLFGPVVVAGQTLKTADMTNTQPLIPVDIYRNANLKRQDVATFAWLQFIAAVSPVGGQRGTTGGSFATSGKSPTTTLVWETYQHRTELLPYSPSGAGVPPNPWNATPKYVVNVNVAKAGPSGPLSHTVPFSNYNNLDEASQIGQNLLFFPAMPGQPKPGTDAQVLFEAKANAYESQFVSANFGNLKVPFTLPVGTVEVKAAWKPIESIPAAQRYRYHTASVITYSGTDQNPVAQTATYALVALHIIHKTPNYPAFIFTTFEQVDDFQNQVTNSPSGVYYVPAYQSVAYTLPKTTTFPPTGQTVPNPQIGFNINKPSARSNGVQTALPLGAVNLFPTGTTVKVSVNGTQTSVVAVPVTQPSPTADDVAAVNFQALAAMKGIPGFNGNFVWQYYKLVGVQAVPTNDETTKDFYLANIVVESSQPGIQLFRGFPPIKNGILTDIRNQVNVSDSSTSPPTLTSGGGCQGCHGVAQTHDGFDFSFLFFGKNGSGFGPDAGGITTAEQAAARLAARKYFK